MAPRKTLLLPTDGFLAVTREFINRALSRACPCDLLAVLEGEAALKKTFKDDAPGFLHMDIKYLPLMPD